MAIKATINRKSDQNINGDAYTNSFQVVKLFLALLRWDLSENDFTFISCLDGGTHLASSVEMSPSGIWFRHCSMILENNRNSLQ